MQTPEVEIVPEHEVDTESARAWPNGCTYVGDRTRHMAGGARPISRYLVRVRTLGPGRCPNHLLLPGGYTMTPNSEIVLTLYFDEVEELQKQLCDAAESARWAQASAKFSADWSHTNLRLSLQRHHGRQWDTASVKDIRSAVENGKNDPQIQAAVTEATAETAISVQSCYHALFGLEGETPRSIASITVEQQIAPPDQHADTARAKLAASLTPAMVEQLRPLLESMAAAQQSTAQALAHLAANGNGSKGGK